MANEISGYTETVTKYLNTALFNLIQDQQLTLSQLKIILLICYHQFISENPNKLISSLLISVLKQIVDIEDNNNTLMLMEQISTKWNKENADEYLENFIHPRVKKIIEDFKDKN